MMDITHRSRILWLNIGACDSSLFSEYTESIVLDNDYVCYKDCKLLLDIPSLSDSHWKLAHEGDIVPEIHIDREERIEVHIDQNCVLELSKTKERRENDFAWTISRLV